MAALADRNGSGWPELCCCSAALRASSEREREREQRRPRRSCSPATPLPSFAHSQARACVLLRRQWTRRQRVSCRAAAGLACRGRGRCCRANGGRPRLQLAMATASACARSSAPPWPREGEHGLHEHASERADVGPSTGKGTPLAPMRRQASSWPECAAPCDGHW